MNHNPLSLLVALATTLAIVGGTYGAERDTIRLTGNPRTGDTRASTPSSTDAVADSAITARIKAELLADETIAGTNIDVETNEGEVKLSGFMESRAQIDRALRIVRSVEGVRKVDNELSVKQDEGK